MSDKLNRREFLRFSAGALSTAFLAACKPPDLGQKAVELFSTEAGLDLQIGVFGDAWKSNAVQEIEKRTGKKPFDANPVSVSQKIIDMGENRMKWGYATDRLTNQEFFSLLGSIDSLNKLKTMSSREFAGLLNDTERQAEFGRDIQQGITEIMKGRTGEKALKQSMSVINNYDSLADAYPESGFVKTGELFSVQVSQMSRFVESSDEKVSFAKLYQYRLATNKFDAQATLRDLSIFYKMWARNDLGEGTYIAHEFSKQEQLAERFITTIEDEYLVVGKDFGDYAREVGRPLVDTNPVFSTVNLIGGAYHTLDIWALSYYLDMAPIKFMVLGDSLRPNSSQGAVKLATDINVLRELGTGLRQLENHFKAA